MPKRAMNPIAADTLKCMPVNSNATSLPIREKGTINAAGTRKTEHR